MKSLVFRAKSLPRAYDPLVSTIPIRTGRPCVCAFSFSLLALVVAGFAVPAPAQESPYIVTYDHYLEEPGSSGILFNLWYAVWRQ
jgi:hypothetical protein